jgi:RNA-directed DNA polymerase
VNTDAPWPDLLEAERRVLGIQTKLRQWAAEDPHRRFDDLFNLVADPAFLTVAWARVRGNRGARSAGVDGVVPRCIVFGVEGFLAGLRDDIKARRFAPLPVRERMIPKPRSAKRRTLGIPTARDRTVQAALKLVLEPISRSLRTSLPRPCHGSLRSRLRVQGGRRRGRARRCGDGGKGPWAPDGAGMLSTCDR